jgi:SAM-dependent methyltransferase
MADVASQRDMATVRRLLGRHLAGSGVEIGPGHHPFPVAFPGVTVAYLDRWKPEENQNLFPELGPEAVFSAPDYVCNLDLEGLKPLADTSQDFVIASHVLEHVAEPIGLIDEMHRVLKPGGVALVLLPDRRRTFDRRRRPTQLEHLVAEFEAGVTEVDDDHIRDFLEGVGGPDFDGFERGSAGERQAILDRHRRRSIHVHCWAEHEFLPVLLFSIRHLGHRWEFVDGVTVDDEGPAGIEFGYVLRRSTIELPHDVLSARFEATWTAWVEHRRGQNRLSRRVALFDSVRRKLRPIVGRSPWAYAAIRRFIGRSTTNL